MLDAKFRLIRHEFATDAKDATQEPRNKKYGHTMEPS